MDPALTLEYQEKDYQKETGSPFEDSLTGLYNHGFFQLVLERETERAKRYGSAFTLAFLDVDDFALFNERHGALTGDLLLRGIAATIRNNIRQTDVAARYAGDGFAILMADTDPAGAAQALERIQHKICALQDEEVSVCIGMAGCPQNAADKSSLLEKTAAALDRARSRGANNLFYFDENQPVSTKSENPSVLLVDDEPLNLKLLEALLLPMNYDLHKATDGFKALDIISEEDIDLILLDVMMPDMDGFEVCRRIKTHEGTRMVPVILVTALDDMESKIKGIEAGADDFISKPPNRAELLARTKSLIKLKKLNSNLASIETVLFSLANAVEAKDAYTQGHISRVSTMGVHLGRKMALSQEELEALRFGGALHDIGKIGISEGILNKPGPLDPEEWSVMQTHTEIGYHICLPLKKNLGAALDVVRHHHEKMDGSGYPDGIAGEAIPMVARIMAVADIYDALVTDRPYREGLSKEKAIEILSSDVQNGKLDPTVVENLIQMVKE